MAGDRLFALLAHAALVAALLVGGACNEDTFRARDGCSSDEECVAPRLCVDGACVDPDGWVPDTEPDADPTDADTDADTDDVETGFDVRPHPGPTPDVPIDVTPPADCARVTPRLVDFGTILPDETSRRLIRVENCGASALALSVTGSGEGLTVEVGASAVGPGDVVLVDLGFGSATPIALRTELTVTAGSLDPVEVEVRGRVDEDLIGDEPVLRFTPTTVDFGAIDQNATPTRPVSVCNDGVGLLEVARAAPIDGPSEVFDVPVAGLRIASGECRVVEVSFTGPPISTQPAPVFEARYRFDSNSSAPSPELTVRGTVVTGGLPGCLEPIDPYVEFELDEGEAIEFATQFVNCGERPLRILDAAANGIGDSAIVAAVEPPVGDAVPPGGELVVFVIFEAPRPGRYGGAIEVVTDAAAAAVEVGIVVGGAVECPEVRAGASTSIRGPFEPALAAVSGQTVYLDPQVDTGAGGVEWTPVEYPTVAPRLASTSFRGRVQFVAEATGDYVFAVQYFGDDGCASEGFVRVSITRQSGVGDGLRFVITWRTPGDPDELEDPGSDVDMHLLPADAGRRRSWNSDNDCYYANRETSWGARLLRDELDGIGPEIIVLEEPELDRDYLLGVYYFSDDDFGPSDVTLRIFRDGIEIISVTRTLEYTGRFWLAAEVLSGGTEIVLPDEPNHTEFP